MTVAMTAPRKHRQCSGMHPPAAECKESDARSLRGGGGELGNLKNLNLWLHYFCIK
jgi:hypothetical protein